MIEAQDDLDAFKAAHLPIEGNWDEITFEYGEQEDVEMTPAEEILGIYGSGTRREECPPIFQAFNHLAQYATEYVNTKEKKSYAFLRGMNATLKEHLTWQTTGTYKDLVNATIVQEGAMRQVEEEDRKRKAPASAFAPHRRSITGFIVHPPDSVYGHHYSSSISNSLARTTRCHHSNKTFHPMHRTNNRTISTVHHISSMEISILLPHSPLTVEAVICVITVVVPTTLLGTALHLGATATTTIATSIRIRTGM
ncbi:hypothetical protein PR202_gb12689 [Eleusine coracana subsp. coracana]|uniref:Uncharacterized protein n=1 Tax=Eleusine coracana subsp. coracana TaxID=191504 RepID=A0AAV5ER29_ELECO|nr:hypothetical protein PR202_gb12689 [Eleusine coracana subsp. coracana]